ncbi:MAG: TRAP transporter substrate-binding protein [Microvirga sp.]|nr:TRAP transporter substrate-binding protein [Microvirga sp.]
MRESTALAFAITACVSIVALATTASAEITEKRLQFAHVYPEGNIWNETTERFAAAIAERTEGKVTVSIAAGGTTGSWEEAIEALQIGTNDVVLESIGTLDRYDPLPDVEAFPYLIRDIDHFRAVDYGPVGDAFSDEVAERTGFKIVGAGYRGARKLSANRAVETVEDLAGLRLRVPPLRMYTRTWELLGASAVPMAATEIFTALQQGVIDGQENPIEFIHSFRFYEVQSHVMDTDHVIGAMTFIFDQARFESFSPELQEILIEEGRNAMLWGTDQMIERENEYRRLLEAEGVTLISPDLGPFREALTPVREEFPDLAEWVERFEAVE